MAPGKAAASDRCKVSSNKINVYCNVCQSQIGVFNNEWIRLTSAYARPKDKGTSFGTRVGENTRTVPDGVAHKMAAGCEMAELFCDGCETVIGQYCREAPERKREQMVGQHFYKFSKTQIKDARTAEVVEPVFAAVSEEPQPGTPKARLRAAAPTITSSPLPRPRTAPVPKSSPPQSNGYGGRGQQDGANESPRANGTSENQGGLMNRLLELERLVRAGSVVTSAPQRMESVALPHDAYGFGRPSVSDQIIEEQKKQIESMTTQMNTLRATIDDLRGVIQDLRADKARQQSTSLQENAVLNHFEEMMRSVRDSQPTNTETDLLRAENQRLKDRLSTIAGAMGVTADDAAQNGRNSPPNEHDQSNSLGKRKRESGPPSRMGFRNGDTFPSEHHFIHPGNDVLHPLTPESMQEMAAGRGPTPAGRPLPPPPQQHYPPQHQPYVPHLRFNFPDPNLRQYGADAPSSAYYPTPQAMYHQPPPPPMFPSNADNYQPAIMQRPESRMTSRPPPPQQQQQQPPPEIARAARPASRNARRSSGANNVEFSDDEIATANASDAPLSIPRPRPLPPNSLPPYRQPNYACSSTNNNNAQRGMSDARSFPPPPPPSVPPYQTPSVRNYGNKHVPRSLTCTSLRQPATGYGVNNALHFTPEAVKERIRPNKARPAGSQLSENPMSGAGAKEEPLSDEGLGRAIERPGTARPCGRPEEIPIDPALEDADVVNDEEADRLGEVRDAGRAGKQRGTASAAANDEAEGDDHDDDDDDDEAPYRPGRSSVAAKKQKKTKKNSNSSRLTTPRRNVRKAKVTRKSMLDREIDGAVLEGAL